MAGAGPESFIEILKRIEIPDVDDYNPEDFASMFANKELGPILESLCSLTVDNVLPSEELSEKNVKRQERHLAHIEEQNKTLQKSKDLQKSHLRDLQDDKMKLQNILIDAKRKYQRYCMENLPKAQAELISVFKTIYQLIMELKKLITESEYNSELPSLCCDAESYLRQEKQLSSYIQDFFSKNFENENVIPIVPEFEDCSSRELLNFLKVLKKSTMKKLKAASKKENLTKIVDFYKKCKENFPSDISEISSSELWSRLEEDKLKEKLIAKEKLLHIFLSAAVAERTDAKCGQVTDVHSEELLQAYKAEKLQDSLEEAINLDRRLKLVVVYLVIYAEKFSDIQKLIKQFSMYVGKEEEIIYQRKANFEKDLDIEIPEKDKYLPEDSVYLSVFNILKSMKEDNALSTVTMDDVLKEVDKKYKQKEELDKLQNQKLDVLYTLQNQICIMEKIVLKGKEFANLCEMDENFSAKLNAVGFSSLDVKNTLREVQDYLDTKQKLIKTDRKLRLARYLYLFALCNEEKNKICC